MGSTEKINSYYLPLFSSKPGQCSRETPSLWRRKEVLTLPQAPGLAYSSARPSPAGGFHSTRLPKRSHEPRPPAHLSTNRVPWPKITTGTLGAPVTPGSQQAPTNPCYWHIPVLSNSRGCPIPVLSNARIPISPHRLSLQVDPKNPDSQPYPSPG